MRVPLPAAVLLSLAVAGCTGTPDAEGLGTSGDADATPSVSDGSGPGMGGGSEGPDPVRFDVAFDGNIGQGVAACEFDVLQDCEIHETKPYSGQVYVEANGTLLGGTFTASWTVESALSEELGFGAMTMTPGCADECHAYHFMDVEGPSPLTIEIPQVDFVLEPEEVLHLYVYSLTYHQAGSVGVEVDAGQAFHLEGSGSYLPHVTP